MDKFDEFVKNIVSKWTRDKKKLLENAELGGLSNRQHGDIAEDYILEKVNALGYESYKTPGSRSPADIIALTWHSYFWHIMLIQVKSSNSGATIYRLNNDDQKELKLFAQFIKRDIVKSTSKLSQYKDHHILISTGCAYVIRNKNNTQHKLDDACYFSYVSMNFKIDEIREEYLKLIHKLSI